MLRSITTGLLFTHNGDHSQAQPQPNCVSYSITHHVMTFDDYTVWRAGGPVCPHPRRTRWSIPRYPAGATSQGGRH